MSSETKIRAAVASDLDAIGRIYGWSVENETASYELVAPSMAVLRARMQSVLSADLPYLVAQLDQQVVGFAYASPYRRRPGYRFTVEDTVYVDREARGRKLGKGLVTELVVACEHLGYRQMLAIIGGANPGPSLALHAACGFEEVGRMRSIGWKLDGWHDVVTMQRCLGVGDEQPPHSA